MERTSSLLLTLAQPQWAVPLFLALWLVASALLARMAGWRSLARQFAAADPPSGESFRFVSASLGSVHWPIRYRHCLRVVVAEKGLYTALMFPFNFQSPALFLPWTAVESVSEKQLFSDRAVSLHLAGHWPVVTLFGPVGQLARAAREASRIAAHEASRTHDEP